MKKEKIFFLKKILKNLPACDIVYLSNGTTKFRIKICSFGSGGKGGYG